MAGLRILGGQARSRKLKTLKKDDYSVRPLLGRIKKSLFDILAPYLPGAVFLDLFAGTGAVGLEALSRGAKSAVFVEKDHKCVKLIEENLKDLGWADRAEVVVADVLEGVSRFAGAFDIVFMGPPYVDAAKRPLALTSPVLEKVSASAILKPGSLIISQHQIKEPVCFPAALEMFRREKYGDTCLSFSRLRSGG
ncbi:MAG: 16S rRNA (guanine(966)-N(2))-methyltransferase RsmD [Endomicrobiales bacterium]|nr:16S rRNA (guanine(966)-N(2))-methyltransferase RsmD [Endomicrobiales bacterium]